MLEQEHTDESPYTLEELEEAYKNSRESTEAWYKSWAANPDYRAILNAVREKPLTSLKILRTKLAMDDNRNWDKIINRLDNNALLLLVQSEDQKTIYADIAPDGLEVLTYARELFPTPDQDPSQSQ